MMSAHFIRSFCNSKLRLWLVGVLIFIPIAPAGSGTVAGNAPMLGSASVLPEHAPSGKTEQLTASNQLLKGLAKSDWQSIRAAYEAGLHAFKPVEGGWQARNPGQQWITKFDRRGFLAQPKDGGWQWGLELQSYGWGQDRMALS